MASSPSILNGTIDQCQWVVQINQLAHNDALPAASQTPSSTFRLPDFIRDDDPESYIPRRIALGPFHHFRPELYNMELYKLGEAKEEQMELHLPGFHELVVQLKPFELRIRASFDQHLDINCEALLWIMLIDGLFLLKLLQKGYPHRPLTLRLPLQIMNGKLSSEFEIISDVLKLENQIPFVVLKCILQEKFNNDLTPILYQFCASVFPFDLPSYDPERLPFGPTPNLQDISQQSHHLLHFLYLLILLMPDEIAVVKFSAMPFSMATSSTSVDFLSQSLNILGSILNIAFIQQLKEAIGLIQRLFQLLGLLAKPNLSDENRKAPLIPSASDLANAGLSFKSEKTNILNCRFDKVKPNLTLPSIHVDGFSQVLLKNLVAFEAISELNPPCLIQYIELMNGLLTNYKDVKILKEANIIYNYLDSDEEVVKLFNGVQNSISSLKKTKTSVPKVHIQDESNMGQYGNEFNEEIKDNYEKGLKGMVEEINKFYENCWRTKMKNFFKKYVNSTLMVLAILIILFLCVLVIARLVCSFFGCSATIFKSVIAADVKSLGAM